MTKRKFIGLGRKSSASRLTQNGKKKQWDLPDNFIFGFTNQHRDTTKPEPKKKVNSEE